MQAVLLRGMFLIGWRDRIAIGIMLAKLRERRVIESGRLRKLASGDRQQQRLHGKGIDRNRANQPSPEQPQFRATLIWSGWHAQAHIAIDGPDEERFLPG